MSQTASTPPTALFRGGKASADSFNANREVERISGRAKVRDEKALSSTLRRDTGLAGLSLTVGGNTGDKSGAPRRGLGVAFRRNGGDSSLEKKRRMALIERGGSTSFSCNL
jgi:hypothetical protein